MTPDEVERVAAALDAYADEQISAALRNVPPELFEQPWYKAFQADLAMCRDGSRLLRSLARDAARLELALATERGKLEKADAVADAWAKDAARYRYLRDGTESCIEMAVFPCALDEFGRGRGNALCDEVLDAAIDAKLQPAIEAAGRKEGGAG
jgi:hypothetical protein